jgi:coproporphyrinogen III oxidase
MLRNKPTGSNTSKSINKANSSQKTKTNSKNSKKLTSNPKRKFYSTDSLPDTTKNHVSRFLPKISAIERCNNISQDDESQLFSSKLPHTTKSLKKMEHFIMNLQSTLVSHIEALESELTPASELQQDQNEHDITNIPVVKQSSQKTPSPKFQIERSTRDPNSGMLGGGVVAVLQGGNVFEKAGCNTSVIHGIMPIDRLHNMRADHKGLHDVLSQMNNEDKAKGLPFSVAGISLVFHPHNPHQPTVHANYRMFQIHTPKGIKKGINHHQNGDILSQDDENEDAIYWFGGGSDLTPTFIEKEGKNAEYGKHFHGVLSTVMNDVQNGIGKGNGDINKLNLIKNSGQKNNQHHANQNNTNQNAQNLYNFTKEWCDEYFYIPHRNETRGLGGIFYDDFDQHSTGLSQNELFTMVTKLGDSFPSSYFPLIVSNKDKKYTAKEKQFQQLRRGRYVEFNVMYDRGTKFGLQMPKTAAVRVEQILMSLPLTARYEYCFTPEIGSPEANTQEILQSPIEWAGKL